MDFLIKETSRSNADFTRLKIAEGLIPLLSEVSTQSSQLAIL